MIQNRDSFLQMLADKMGRAPRTEPLPPPAPVNDYELHRFGRCGLGIALLGTLCSDACQDEDDAPAEPSWHGG